jgi:hypothetical protein
MIPHSASAYLIVAPQKGPKNDRQAEALQMQRKTIAAERGSPSARHLTETESHATSLNVYGKELRSETSRSISLDVVPGFHQSW